MELYKKIAHNHCGCVFSTGIEDERCLKRYYILNDYENGQQIKLSICNEYLRLKIAEERNKRKDLYLHNNVDLNEILISIFSEYVNVYEYSIWHLNKRNGNINTINIATTLCQSPKIITHINLLDAIEIVRLGNYIDDSLKHSIAREVKYFTDTYIRSKVSVNKYQKVSELINKIYKCWDRSKREIYMNELFITIFELSI
jgi:hypothetical protein